MNGWLRAYRAVWRTGLALQIPRWILGARPEELAERLGESPRGGAPAPLWLHGASMGEVNAVGVLVEAIRRRGATRLALSAVTRTGKRQARGARPDLGPFHAPLDAPQAVRRCLDRLAPRGLVLVESELWPNLLLELNRRGTPWAVASGRISERSARWLGRLGSLAHEILAPVAAVGARTEADALRFRELGAPAESVRVTGDLKEDRHVSPRVAPDYEIPRWLAACTRPGEEEDVLQATARLRGAFPRGELTLAPRHPERFEEVARLATRRGFPVRRWAERTEPPANDGWSVVLVDEMGVLDEAYRRNPLAFVGGSLRPFGGHSPLEAAALGRAMLLGPHTENCADAAGALEQAGAAQRVRGEEGLTEALLGLLADRDEVERRGRAAHRVMEELGGSAERTVDLLVERGLLP